MCKTRDITYSCSHTHQFRLSTCRGTFSGWTKKNVPIRAACRSAPFLVLKSKQPCGSCQRQAVEQTYEKQIEELRAACNGGWDFMSPELIAAEAEYEAQSFILTSEYPGRRLETYSRPERRRGMTALPPSPLKEEVKSEELSEKWDCERSTSWEGDWGSGWKTMSEELEELAEEKREEMMEYEPNSTDALGAWSSEDQEDDADALPLPITGAWADESKEPLALQDPSCASSDTLDALPPPAPQIHLTPLENKQVEAQTPDAAIVTNWSDIMRLNHATSASASDTHRENVAPPSPRLRRRPRAIGTPIKLGSISHNSGEKTIEPVENEQELTHSFRSTRDSGNPRPRIPPLKRKPAVSSIRRKSLMGGGDASGKEHTCFGSWMIVST